jgi:hypothetical protein
VARGLAAGLQAGLAVATYGCCRLLAYAAARRRVRRGGGVRSPFWPIASQHWLARFVQSFLSPDRPPGTRVDRPLAGARAVLGVLAATQHQKAIPFALLGSPSSSTPPPRCRPARAAALPFAPG